MRRDVALSRLDESSDVSIYKEIFHETKRNYIIYTISVSCCLNCRMAEGKKCIFRTLREAFSLITECNSGSESLSDGRDLYDG